MPHKPVALLVRMAAGPPGAAARSSRSLDAKLSLELEPLMQVPQPSVAREGLAARGPTPPAQWYVTHVSPESENPWDQAHDLMVRSRRAGLAAAQTPDFLEPDLLQDWIWKPTHSATRSALAAAPTCKFVDQATTAPFRTGEFAWHLGDSFSQLASARKLAEANSAHVVRIAHLDTGYDKDHQLLASVQYLHELERNFIDEARPENAEDLGADGALRNPGHGTGTLGILAGGAFKFQKLGYSFRGIIGGAPNAQIVPIRVGNSVVQLTTSAVAKGINYAVELCASPETRIDVISMSMGGVASAAWADAVNKAYEAGIVFVAAAGNNYAGLPTRQIVYPARFRRVLALVV